jgi:hypothetical protein
MAETAGKALLVYGSFVGDALIGRVALTGAVDSEPNRPGRPPSQADCTRQNPT